MLSWWIFDRSPQEWSELSAGVASIATAVALIIGGVWAWHRFRKTPESRVKITLSLEIDWAASSKGQVVVRVSATNDGGYRWILWWSATSGLKPYELVGVDVFGEQVPAALRHDVSRVSLWATSTEEAEVFERGYADWNSVPRTRAELGCEEVELRPKDVWANDILFRVPANTDAILVAANVWVRSRRKVLPIQAFRIQTQPVLKG